MSGQVEQKRSGRALTPWELPKLLKPMHRWKRCKRGKGPVPWRSHFLPILAFVYRNRFAVASQIQRRFPKALPSDRTARRHLSELEATGCLGVADTRSTSPLFPKVYFVTGRGVRRIEESLRERGKRGRCCRRDRGRPEAYSPDHVLHEILTTEFLLNVWQCCARREDLELLSAQRRALERHSAFVIGGSGRGARLKPDAMFLYRQDGGLMCCFLELDNGTMGPKQMRAKFAGYDDWGRSSVGQQYLTRLYRSHGAERPKAIFRVLVVARHRRSGNDGRRLDIIAKAAKRLSSEARHRSWFTSVNELQQANSAEALDRPIWRRGNDAIRVASGRPNEGILYRLFQTDT